MNAHQYELLELLSYLDTAEIHPLTEIKTAIFENLNKSREPWLVNAVVDMFMASNSNRCLDVLVCINEPHDKHLFDRLNEHMKGNQKMGAFVILAHLVHREPVWLHKIVSVQLLSTLLKSLKVETDGLVLLTGSLILTGLLPIVPVSIAPFLMDFCEVFNALAMFCLNKSGNIPEAYLMHLQVGLHCMFHRLYSMYPWHFLTYLRNIYSRPENLALFDNIIKPMFNFVKMHPLLVTGSKDKETSRDRWKEKEVHDIIVECAQLSLDPFDREFLESRGLSGWQDRCPQKPIHSDGSKQDFARIGSKSALQVHEPACSESSGALWSPSKRCGLSTPPPENGDISEKTTPITTQSAVSGITSEESMASLQSQAEAAPVEELLGPKSEDPLPETSVIPPLLVEPPTPPDISRGTDGKASSSLLGFCSPPDGCFSSNDPTSATSLTSNLFVSSSLPSGPSEAGANAAEMVALVKKMKRIRLNSINVARDLKSALPLSRSCPHLLLPLSSTQVPEDDQLTASQGNLERTREWSGSDKWMVASGTTPLMKSSVEMATSRTPPVAVTMVSEESQTGLYVFARSVDHVPSDSEAEEAEEEEEEEENKSEDLTETILPFELLLGLVLPFAPFVQCYCCMRRHWDSHYANHYEAGHQNLKQLEMKPIATKSLGCVTPLHMSCSPSHLLDKHIMQSCELHGKVPDIKVTASSSQTKFAATSTSNANDLNLLRTHVLLMHNQLIFERYRQELHAKRNRRLLGRTVRVVSLEEQNNAMKDQLRLQESEMVRLRSDLKIFRNKNHDLERTIISKNKELSDTHGNYLRDVESLKLQVKELEESLTSQKNFNDQLVLSLERTNNKLFSKEKDLELLRFKVESQSHLERQVIQLNTELLLMGELHQKYQQRLSEMTLVHIVHPQLQMCLDSCKAECQSLRLQLREKTLALDEANSQVTGVESQLNSQEKSIAELKNKLETSQTPHLEHIQRLEERHKCDKKTQLDLEARIFKLQSDLELHKNRHPQRGAAPRSTHFTHHGIAISEAETSAGGSVAMDHQSSDHSSS